MRCGSLASFVSLAQIAMIETFQSWSIISENLTSQEIRRDLNLSTLGNLDMNKFSGIGKGPTRLWRPFWRGLEFYLFPG